MDDHHEPRLIPQFSVNSNMNLLTQMQINLHCEIRNKNNIRKNCLTTKSLLEKFDEEISKSILLSKTNAIYLTNAVF